MHENANRGFVGELRTEDIPDTFTRVVVHGRVLSPIDGVWHMVVTDILPGGELSSVYGDGFHGATRLVGDGEFVTWGGEPVEVDKLKIVSHSGVRIEYPGWVLTGVKGERGKIHARHYQFAGVNMTVGCGRVFDQSGSTDASWFMDQRNVCRDCRKSVKAVIDKM